MIKETMTVEAILELVKLATKEVLSLSEAAEYMSMKKSYLYKLMHRKQLAYHKPSGKLAYFKRSDLDYFLLQNRISTIDEIEEKAQSHCLRNGGAKK